MANEDECLLQSQVSLEKACEGWLFVVFEVVRKVSSYLASVAWWSRSRNLQKLRRSWEEGTVGRKV